MFGFDDILGIAAPVIGGLLGGSGGSSSNGGAGTTTKNPWEPAAPFLKDNLQTNADLQKYYQQNPFNAQQQTSYNNIFGDLNNFRNNTAPGLMQFANNAMTGSYQRPQHSAPGMAGYSSAPNPRQSQGGGVSPNVGMDQLGSGARFSINTPPQQPQNSQFMSPSEFKSYLYANGGDDQAAITRGLQYAKDNKMTPQQFLNLTNSALGSNFDMSNYRAVAGDADFSSGTPGGMLSNRNVFSVNHTPENTYAMPDWNAMNPHTNGFIQQLADKRTANAAKPAQGLLSGGSGGGEYQPSTSSGGSAFSNVNDTFHSIQNGINTPAGAGAAYAASLLGLLGNTKQDPTNVPVTDLSTYGGEAIGSYGGDMGDMSDGIGYYKGGMVDAKKLTGPDPKGPDEGYAPLQGDEYVIKKAAVKKYGRGLLDDINSGTYKKG